MPVGGRLYIAHHDAGQSHGGRPQQQRLHRRYPPSGLAGAAGADMTGNANSGEHHAGSRGVVGNTNTGRSVACNSGNVYAGNDGNVYKHDQGADGSNTPRMAGNRPHPAPTLRISSIRSVRDKIWVMRALADNSSPDALLAAVEDSGDENRIAVSVGRPTACRCSPAPGAKAGFHCDWRSALCATALSIQ